VERPGGIEWVVAVIIARRTRMGMRVKRKRMRMVRR
jgi:hypothetical protein